MKPTKTDEFVEVDEVNKAAEVANKVNNKPVANDTGVSIKTPLLLPFSLTKYSTIFAEVKESFGIFGLGNQLSRFGNAVNN
jgi:hypothetical protein